MAERRSLTDGLKATPPVNAAVAKEFIHGNKSGGAVTSAQSPSGQVPSPTTPSLSRVPFSTRMRSDFASALKRASLERQLKGIEPYTLTDIFEQAIEPWLKSNGYLT